MQKYNAVVAILLSLFYTTKSEDAIKGGTYQNNKFVNKWPMKFVENRGPKMCVKECLHVNGCSGVNFDRVNLKCELLSDEDSSSEPIYQEGYMYTDMHHWQMPENSCWPTNPCSRRQKCVPTNQNGGYKCLSLKKARVCKDCVRFGSSRYKFVDISLNMNDSLAACTVIGGKLVEVETEVENNFLKDYMASNYNPTFGFWLGAYIHSQNPDTYRWISNPNEPMAFSEFYPGEPDNRFSQENCLGFYIAFSYSWVDLSCETQISYICELSD